MSILPSPADHAEMPKRMVGRKMVRTCSCGKPWPCDQNLWNQLRTAVAEERQAKNEQAGDHEESGHWRAERCYGAVAAFDWVLSLIDAATPETAAGAAGKEQDMAIRNTTDDMRDPAEQLAFLASGMATGNAGNFIEGQERDGQRQLLVSDRLPADTERILAWLTRNPGSTAGEAAMATGFGSQYVFARLRGAEMAGRAKRDREHGAASWRWKVLRPRRLSDGQP